MTCKGFEREECVHGGKDRFKILPILTYESEIWMWNRPQQSKVHAVEMSYLRGACGVTRCEGDSYGNMYGRYGMGACANGMKCGVVEYVKKYTEVVWLY